MRWNGKGADDCPYGAGQPSAWNVRLRENPGRGLAIHIHDGLVEFLLTAGLGRFALGFWRMPLRLRAKAYLLRTPCPCRHRSWHNGRLPFV